MATTASLIQSEQHDSVPFITVQQDHRGSACWVVVGRDIEVRCYCGQRALAILDMLCKSRGISVPQ
jgi:hypothetical protein